MDDYIEQRKDEGGLTLDELRHLEHLRTERGEGWVGVGDVDLSRLWEPQDFTYDPRRTWRQNYEVYLLSDMWRRTRGIAILKAGNRCTRCGWQTDHTGKGLEVHHKTYKRLGNELPEDLEVVCRPCHEIADQERAQRNKRGK